MSAIRCLRAWKEPIARPNCLRDLVYSTVCSTIAAAAPTCSADNAILLRAIDEAVYFLGDDFRICDGDIVAGVLGDDVAALWRLFGPVLVGSIRGRPHCGIHAGSITEPATPPRARGQQFGDPLGRGGDESLVCDLNAAHRSSFTYRVGEASRGVAPLHTGQTVSLATTASDMRLQ